MSNLEKLIKWLEDNPAKHTRGNLRNGNCFCVLGAACELSGLGVWKSKASGYYYYINGKGSYTFAPAEVFEWLGIEASSASNAGTFNDRTSSYDAAVSYLKRIAESRK